MVYIKSTNYYMDCFGEESKLPDQLKKIIFKVKALTGRFFVKKTQNGEIILLPDKNKRIKKNLEKFLKIYGIKTVCISKDLEEDKFFEEFDLNILNGKWLYKYLIFNYIKYISKEQEKRLQEIEVSFLVNQITELDLENIEEISKEVKIVNVITNSTIRIKKLAEKLYSENGVIINTIKNHKKSLIKSNIIINIDFSEEELNKYLIPRKAIIINIGPKTKVKNKGFNGINIWDYNTSIPKKYLDNDLNTKTFRKEVLYESYIYKNTSPRNIFKEIKKDNIYIESLIGQKGIIRKAEFSK